MTSDQQHSERALAQAEADFLRSYHWRRDARTARWSHQHAPKEQVNYDTRDAMQLTRANKLLYGCRR